MLLPLLALGSCRRIAAYSVATSDVPSTHVDAWSDSAQHSEAGLDLPHLDSRSDSRPDLAPDLQSDSRITDCSGWVPPPAHFDPCTVGLPATELVLSAAGTWQYDTDTGKLTNPQGIATTPVAKLQLVDGVESRLISVENFALAKGVVLRVIGSRPLLVAAWNTLTVDGTIDVSSNATVAGAGANPAACSSNAATAGDNHLTDGGGGGGGGGFGAGGGQGGLGGGTVSGGSKGTAVAATAPMLRGGCPGARGGKTYLAGGLGGAGGGALQLTARSSIEISGVLHAGGAGGRGGPAGSQSGGGGGGSGGYLGLEAPRVTLTATAVLAANGGGGGGGAADALAGQPGKRGLADSTGAAGGPGGAASKGGDGGSGGHLTVLAGTTGQNSVDGGGGGGGGVGLLVLEATTVDDQGATLSAKRAP